MLLLLLLLFSFLANSFQMWHLLIDWPIWLSSPISSIYTQWDVHCLRMIRNSKNPGRHKFPFDCLTQSDILKLLRGSGRALRSMDLSFAEGRLSRWEHWGSLLARHRTQGNLDRILSTHRQVWENRSSYTEVLRDIVANRFAETWWAAKVFSSCQYHFYRTRLLCTRMLSWIKRRHRSVHNQKFLKSSTKFTQVNYLLKMKFTSTSWRTRLALARSYPQDCSSCKLSI